MLKEVATLTFVLWCAQAFPTTTVANKYKPSLFRLYCDAELLFGGYKNGKHFPLEMRPTIEKEFSGPNCNFTKAPKEAEVCKIIQAYHELFTRLNKTKRDDSLLKPLMANHSFSSIVWYQGNYLESNCPQVAQIRVARIEYLDFYHPLRQNMFYYIFEQYKYCTLKLWRQQLTLEVDERNLCGYKQ